MPAALEDVEVSGKVGLFIGMRVLQRIAHTRLGSQMADAIGSVRLET